MGFLGKERENSGKKKGGNVSETLKKSNIQYREKVTKPHDRT